MLRIASGVIDQVAYFNPGDLGLSSFTVYRARNGAAPAELTTPTIVEEDSTNMPGEYSLLLDQDMTIGGGNLTEAMVFFITHIGMSPQRIEIELFDPNSYVVGTVTVNTDMRGTDSAATAANLTVVDTVVDAIKVVTDKFVFTIANQADVNIQYINDTQIVGDGSATPFNV